MEEIQRTIGMNTDASDYYKKTSKRYPQTNEHRSERVDWYQQLAQTVIQDPNDIKTQTILKPQNIKERK
jgi:hypothetical protein